MKLHYKELGAPTAPPMVIMHGLFGTLDNWMTLGRALAEEFHVYLLDMRNHGHSPHAPEWDYFLMAEDLLEFLDDRGLEQVLLVGHSMGGKAAMQFAALHPERLRGMVVVDIAPRHYPPHHQQILGALGAVRLEGVQSRGEVEQQLAAHIADDGVRLFLLKNLYRKPEGGFGWRMNLPVIASRIEEVGKALLQRTPIEVPTLFVGGGASGYILPPDEADIAERFAHAQVVMLPGAGHWVHAERPRELLGLLREFAGKFL